MRTFIFLCVVASICVVGCDAGGNLKPTSAQDKKDFSGGPMPADARAKFEAAMKQNDANRANSMNKVQQNAAATGGAGNVPVTHVGSGN
jgi:hypothetical protein